MSFTRTRRLTTTAPVVAAALVASASGVAQPAGTAAKGPSRAAAGTELQTPQVAADPCDRRWPAHSTKPSAGAHSLGRTAPTTGGPAASRRPNILTIMVDDMRADEIRGPWMKHTRNLIGKRGATFRNSFAPYPLCGPARASFLTGKYSHNHGVRDNTKPSAFRRLHDGNTVATWLDRDGSKGDYTTAFLGKYINGYADPTYVPPGWDHWNASLGKTTQQARSTKLSRNGHGVIDLDGQFQTKAYGERGARLVSRFAKRKRPFFMTLSFSAPHVGGPREPDDPPGLRTPARLPKNRHLYEDRIVRPQGVRGEPCNRSKPSAVTDLPRIGPAVQRKIVELRQQRAQSLVTVDAQVRRVMGALRRSGELSNTYVIFTSDNGFFLGEFRQRAGKRLSYEPALRTPTLVRGPGISRGVRPRAPFTSIDFAPTIAAMARVKKHGRVDGASLLSAARSGESKWRRAILTDAGPYEGEPWYGRGVRARGLMYARYRDPRVTEELFDIAADPQQNHNVVDRERYRKATKRMRTAYRALRDCRGRECR
ncbi:sulfatase family protein [Solicola gregarius]|uniref:Sulfatase n=1 Tax=Solicola gregarius TaxID=2908642 RepID=A0AA46YJB3_9ACTN|nr:sulfatase [Solicola gregarius]UYM04365.1 sulfatase [Solicola gregarius]